MSVEIVQGSILDFEGDAIVNAANGFLMHGAGLARVIANAATRDFKPEQVEGYPHVSVQALKAKRFVHLEAAAAFQRENAEHRTIATGNVAVTSAGVLPYRGIIHAVGPVWDGGVFCERQLLSSAYGEAVAAAVQRGWTRVAFPALSVGLFRFPSRIAAHIAMPILDQSPIDATLYLFHPQESTQRALAADFEVALQMHRGSR